MYYFWHSLGHIKKLCLASLQVMRFIEIGQLECWNNGVLE